MIKIKLILMLVGAALLVAAGWQSRGWYDDSKELVAEMARQEVLNADKLSIRGDGIVSAGQQLDVTPAVSGIDSVEEGLVEIVNGVIQYNGSSNYTQARILVRGYYA